jgi:hypothetical protein
MGIDLTEISQKVLDNNTNAANVFRRQYDLHFNPNPLDVELPYIDENGNTITTKIPNVASFRKRVWDDVGGALGQFNRTFYVDQVNGDDNNDGSSSAPFKTLETAIGKVPIGGFGVIYVKGDILIQNCIYLTNKIIRIIGDNSNNIDFYSTSDDNSNYLKGFFRLRNSIVAFHYITVKAPSKTNSDVGWSWADALFKGIDGNAVSAVGFFGYLNNNPTLVVPADAPMVVWSAGVNIQGKVIFQASHNKIIVNRPVYNINWSAVGEFMSWGVIYEDDDGNSVSGDSLIAGIVRDADSGNPVNLISNINFSS